MSYYSKDKIMSFYDKKYHKNLLKSRIYIYYSYSINYKSKLYSKTFTKLMDNLQSNIIKRGSNSSNSGRNE